MIGFSWIQARVHVIVAGAVLVVAGILVLILRPHVAATDAYLVSYDNLRTWLGIVVVAVPGILGIFVGAPLVARELESGTFRLAWTQSVSRTRWMITKLLVGGLLSMALAGLLSLLVTWWASALDKQLQVTIYAAFDQRDIVPIGFAAFSFALGVTAGVLWRKTLPTMATTFVVFVAVRIAFNEWVRPNLLGSIRRTFPLTGSNIIGFGTNGGPGSPSNLIAGPPDITNAWFKSVEIVDKAGHALTPQETLAACPQLNLPPSSVSGGGGPTTVHVSGGGGFQECAQKLASRFHEVVVYLPASRYWPLQWTELAIYLAAALALGGLCVYLVRSRVN